MTDRPRDRATIGRWFWLSGVAWLSMLGVAAAMGAVKWNQPGFRDPDISGPIEMALTIAIVTAVPLALISALILAPLSALADILLNGRLSMTGNALIGASFAVPAVGACIALGFMLYRRVPNGAFADLVAALTVCAIGGVVLSLGIRRKLL